MPPITEQRIREIIREELGFMISPSLDRLVMKRHIQMFDGRNIQLAIGTGTKIGTATGQKIGFWNVTPVIQQAAGAQAAVATTVATQTSPFGYTTAAQADGIITLLNRLRLDLVTTGIIKGSA